MTRAFYYHQFKFDRTINADVTKRSNKENIIKYANIQVNSDLYSQEQRIAHCRGIGLIESVGGVMKLTLTAKLGISTAAAAWDAANF